MRKLIVSNLISLDGYAAGPGGYYPGTYEADGAPANV